MLYLATDEPSLARSSIRGVTLSLSGQPVRLWIGGLDQSTLRHRAMSRELSAKGLDRYFYTSKNILAKDNDTKELPFPFLAEKKSLPRPRFVVTDP